MGVSLLKNVGSMTTNQFTITSKAGSNILYALGVSSTSFTGMYGNGRYHTLIQVNFKVPVILDGFKFNMSGSTLGENWYYLNGSKQGITGGYTTFAPRKVSSIMIERYIKSGYNSIDYNVSMSGLEIFGAYELHLLEIDNKLFTTNGTTVTFVSDNLDAPTSLFMSNGFTTDKLNPTIIKKLAELTKKYRVRTLKL